MGKISGAVGTFAHLPPSVEEHVCGKLGLQPAPASSQIVQRDRHAEYFTALALLGASIEKFAVEIRHLQRTEVREVEEPFTAGQKGSSAMPHKRNPILSENLTGLARLLRGYAVSAMEDVAALARAGHLPLVRGARHRPGCDRPADFMLHRFAGLMENLRVYPEQMQKNLELLGGVVNSQRILLELARKGMDRQAAYVIVQRNAMRIYEEGVDFRHALLADADLLKMMTPEEIDAASPPATTTRHVDEIFRRVFGGARRHGGLGGISARTPRHRSAQSAMGLAVRDSRGRAQVPLDARVARRRASAPAPAGDLLVGGEAYFVARSTRTSSGMAGGSPWPEKPRSLMSHWRMFSLSSIRWSSPWRKRASYSSAIQ